MADASHQYRASPRQLQEWQLRDRRRSAQVEIELTGAVDRDKLRSALDRVVARHEVLRTSLERPPGLRSPVQAVAATGRVDWDGEDGSAGSAVVSTRLTTPGSDGGHQRLAISVAPQAAGVRSLLRLVAELAAEYAGEGVQVEELDEEPIQFGQFAEWLADREEVEDAERDGARPLRLLTEPASPRDESSPAAPRRVGSVLDAVAGEAVAAAAAGLGVEFADFVCAAWLGVLHLWSEASRPAIGLVVDGRPFEDLESSIGPFSRVEPVEIPVEPASRFEDLARLAARERAAAGERDEPRVDDDAGWSGGPAAGVRFHPLPPAAELRGGELVFRVVDLRPAAGTARLELVAWPGGPQPRLSLLYDPKRYARDDAELLLGQVKRLLLAAVEHPASRLADLAGALAAAPEESAAPSVEVAAPHETVVGRILAIAWETPSRSALLAPGATLDYGALVDGAGRIAAALLGHRGGSGAGRGARVALLADRSPEMIAGLLGAMGAGAAYCPIDPAQPAERIGRLLAACRPTAILVEAGAGIEVAAAELAAAGVPVLRVRAADGRIELEGAAGSGSQGTVEGAAGFASARPEDAAYVLFTSGSTGAPKGVVVEHRQLAAYTEAATRRLGLAAGASWALVSSSVADLGNTAIYLALTGGGWLLTVPPEVAVDPEACAELLAGHRPDALKIVPPHLEALLTAPSPERLLPRSTLVLGGERLTWKLVEEVTALAPECRVINHYGPTETTVGAIAREVTPECAGRWEHPPLGTPLDGVRVVLAGPSGAPVPTGLRGEILIAGTTVARGYLDDPRSTAEWFRPDPWAPQPGGRLYASGDLAVADAGGGLHFLGRRDHQVKVRGFRVELGEIEAALRAQPGIREAAVDLRRDGDGPPRLVAYTISGPGAGRGADTDRASAGRDLKQALRGVLPEAAMPSAFVALDALPLNPNGKLDRKALPEPSRDRSGARYAAPAPGVESRLAAIWERVLGCDRVGADDNFFDLGGDSILAIQLIARAREEGLSFQPWQIFRHQTVAELARVVDSAEAVEAEQGSVVGDFELGAIHRWFFDLHGEAPDHWNQSALLAVRSPVSRPRLAAALRRLARHHDALRSRFHRAPEGEGAEWRGEIVGEDLVPVSELDLSALPESLRPAALSAAGGALQASLDLADGPLLRAGWFELGGEEGRRLLLAAHHTVVDGVSWRVLLEDLAAELEGGEPGAAPWPAKTTSWPAWVGRLSEWVAEGGADDEIPYWRGVVAVAGKPLPVDSPEGANRTRWAVTLGTRLSAALTEKLLREVPAVYRTQVNDVLLTALARCLRRHSEEKAVVVEIEGHGREPLIDGTDVSRTIGWFTSRYPVALELPADGDPGAGLKAVKETLRAVPRRGVGFGLLRWLHPDPAVVESLAELRTSGVTFNYLGQLDGTFSDDAVLAPAPAEEWGGAERDPRSVRTHELEVTSSVRGGQLRVSWTYSSQRFREESVRALADAFLAELRGLVEHCLGEEAGGFTPSDFPLAGLDQGELDRLADSLGQMDAAEPVAEGSGR